MTVSTYQCTEITCEGTITYDTEANTQHTFYARGKGPVAAGYKPHDCPIRRGIWPPDIEEHPLAKRIS